MSPAFDLRRQYIAARPAIDQLREDAMSEGYAPDAFKVELQPGPDGLVPVLIKEET